MPESETDHLDYYPEGWTERIHDEFYIEWVYDDDPTILVRLDGTAGVGAYSVTPITGVNSDGEEFVTTELSQLSEAEAFEIAQGFIYAINGTAGRLSGELEFTGNQSDS